MSLFKKLKVFFGFRIYKLNTEHETELCFESGGIEYYKFVNEFKIPYLRAMAAMDIYAELDQKTDSKYIKLAFETIVEFLKKGDNINAGRVAINSIERMDNITNMDIAYKLASVLYIDRFENPYDYDYEYNDKKIAKWKKEKDIEGFFLKMPLIDYLPSFDGLAMSMNQYTGGQRKELIRILKSHLSALSEKSKNSELISTLKSEISKLEELVTNS